MKLLITGSSGLYGSKLVEVAKARNIEVYPSDIQNLSVQENFVKLDISDKESVDELFNKTKPHFVVHAAALTDVDKCELNKELAWKTNVEGTKNIVDACKNNDAFLIYISTDYVFSGSEGRYKEDDSSDPINYYGLTKTKAEEHVKNAFDSYCIARPSVIYGSTPAAGKVNFALWLINKLKKGERVKAVTDQWNTPTLNSSFVEMTLEIIDRRLTGTFHLSGATRISRHDFAKVIGQIFGLDESLIDPIKSACFDWLAKRPMDSSLDTSKAQQILSNKPLEIVPALKRLKKEIDLTNC